MTGNDSTKSTDAPDGTPTKRRNWKRIFRLAGIALAIFIIFGGVAVVGMEYYTGRSEFCASCHIMIPYYESWQDDVHSTEADAGCVDCHYAPGEKHTIEAKLRGLSQMLSYFSGRSGNARPRPRVQDESCLRSSCHATSEFIDTVLDYGDVQFVHAMHMEQKQDQLSENTAELQALAGRLRAVDDDMFRQVQLLSLHTGDPEKNRALIRQAVEQNTADRSLVTAAVQYADVVNRNIRLKQLNNLQCSTCHAHSTDEEHFNVNQRICNLCHFTNQRFNTGTGQCLNCHEPPAVSIPVHGGAIKVSERTPQAAAGTMDHSVIIANNVDCVSCHADLIRGTGEVTRQRCHACHDQPHYYEGFDENLDLTVVASLHEVHTTGMHTQCVDCHDTIQHSLTVKDPLTVRQGFLEPVQNDCAQCHPNHHHGQVEIIAGKAPEPIPHGIPSAMFGSRVNCLGCHTIRAEDVKGTTVIEATRQACVVCHSTDYETLFDQWINRLEARIADTRKLESRALASWEDRGQAGSDDLAEVQRLINRGQRVLEFVSNVNGIHNRNYALNLLDYASEQFTRALDMLGSRATTQAEQ